MAATTAQNDDALERLAIFSDASSTSFRLDFPSWFISSYWFKFSMEITR